MFCVKEFTSDNKKEEKGGRQTEMSLRRLHNNNTHSSKKTLNILKSVHSIYNLNILHKSFQSSPQSLVCTLSKYHKCFSIKFYITLNELEEQLVCRFLSPQNKISIDSINEIKKDRFLLKNKFKKKCDKIK